MLSAVPIAKKRPVRSKQSSPDEPRRPRRSREGEGPSRAPAPPPPRRERRALSHVGGRVEFRGGTEEEHDVLRRALAVSADEDQVMADVHGFHSYPARLHPQTAARLIEGLSQKGATVLDPFCGSGTVVVEARALGRQALGSDLNPLAVELAWLKSRGATPKLCSDIVQAATHIAEVADERRRAKAGPTRPYDHDVREKYPIHILLELDSLWMGVDQLRRGEVQRALRLVVSSLLTKVAHSEGDTTRRRSPRRLPSGFAIELFQQKTEELAERLSAYAERLPARAPRAEVTVEDARRLRHLENGSVDLVVTSPPYPGVYDYLDHHLHRLDWLGLDSSRLDRFEIGARREYRRLTLRGASRRWQEEMGEALREIRRVLDPSGRAVLVIADSVVGDTALRADREMERAATGNGLDVTAMASQERPLFLHGAERAFRDAPRREHVVILRPSVGWVDVKRPRPTRRHDEPNERRARSSSPRGDTERSPRREEPGAPGRRSSYGQREDRFPRQRATAGRDRDDRPARGRPPGERDGKGRGPRRGPEGGPSGGRYRPAAKGPKKPRG